MIADDSRTIDHWLGQLREQQRYSAHTIAAYGRDLQLLRNCFPERPLDGLHEAEIRQALARLRSQGLQARSLARALAAWRGYFAWRLSSRAIDLNPAQGVRAPKIPRSLPRALSVDQAQALLDRSQLPPARTPVELRDMAMFEVLYASGLRLAELVGLDWRPLHNKEYQSHSWVQLDEAEVIVRGKGNKSRSAPLGKQAVQALQKWLDVRPGMLGKNPSNDDRAALFLGVRGRRISPRVVQLQLQELARRAGVPVHVHPHSLRHSFASHLLQSAQDLRAVQELLGHANISSTQIYTRLDFQHLAATYDKAHPRAQRKTAHKTPDDAKDKDRNN